jgi:sulfonate transport system substrate-binding protein
VRAPPAAQAADIPFVYFAASSASPESSGILVKRDSNMREANDLRGRRVGFAKGTSAHTLVLHFLEKNHLSLSDIVPVYLAPADGRVALEAGSIDAWSVWDPYLAAAERQGGFREVSSGRGYVEGREFYLASRRIADSHPERLKEFLDELVRVKAWAKARPGARENRPGTKGSGGGRPRTSLRNPVPRDRPRHGGRGAARRRKAGRVCNA